MTLLNKTGYALRVALLLCLSPLALADAGKDADITKLFSKFNIGSQPGVAVLVKHNDKVVYERGFGFADITERKQITPETLFRLASVSKQFTAAAVLKLNELGRLSLEDPVSKHLPELSRYAGVTIQHLLNHTAGLPDYYDHYTFDPGSMPANSDAGLALQELADPQFQPGEQFEYSNPAYEMLALLVERISGAPFRDFMRKQVFTPSGMATAMVYDHTQPTIEQRALGYSPDSDGYTLNDYDLLNGITGSGGVYASLRDFSAWIDALYGQQILKDSTLSRAWQATELNSGQLIDYGLGWSVDSYRGYKRVSHGGSWVGFRTHFASFPEQRLSIVVLANRSDIEPADYVEQIANLQLPENGLYQEPKTTLRWQRNRLKGIPKSDIWWTATGKDMAWMHKNLPQMFPTVTVHRSGPVRPLAQQLLPEIAQHPVNTPDGMLGFDEFLESDHSTAMGVVILRKGKVVFERYPRMQPYEKPIYWSVAKILPATLLRIMEEQGELDVDKPIELYISELANSAFAGTTVRNVLDMASGLDCEDEYEDRNSCYYQYSAAIGDGYRDEQSAQNPYEFLKTLKVSRHAPQGKVFSYSGVNTFLLGWLVEELSGQPLQDVLSQQIWSHIGAEADASFVAYHSGIPLAHGGFLARPRDLARLGLLFTPSYKTVSEKPLISAEHISFLQTQGRPKLLAKAGLAADNPAGIRHNIYQWDQVHQNGTLYKGGWAGQGLIINPEHDVVAVFASYFKDENYSEMPLEPVVFDVINSVFKLNAKAIEAD
ncbi:MAG: serine hydrolase domain-containing protein [Pseudomonadales bacterium]